MANEKNSPLIEQYLNIKQQYANTILLFQVGDFYELFFDDAVTVSSFLALTLTKRGKCKGNDIPLCGIPVHTLHHYLGKLVRGGFSVALCQQLSKPIPGTVVERAVTQVFTPGTLTDSSLLDDKASSYLLTLYPTSTTWSLIFTELLTATMYATTVTPDYRFLDGELIRFFPDEILLPRQEQGQTIRRHIQQQGYFIQMLDYSATPKTVEDEEARDEIEAWQNKHLSPNAQDHIKSNPAVQHNVSMLYNYMKHNQSRALEHLSHFHVYETEDFLLLDKSTQKNLEIIKNCNDGGSSHTLFSTLDNASTPMGSRTIKKWLLRPLVQEHAITARHDVVEALINQTGILLELRSYLNQLGDCERIIGRIALGRAQLSDYRQLKAALSLLPNIKSLLPKLKSSSLLFIIQERLGSFDALVTLLSSSLNEDPRQDWKIKPGFDGQLDYFRHLVTNGESTIKKLEDQEIARTGISSLKIGHNNQSGYYIEVTHTHSHRIPHDYIFQQKLVNRSRYITQQLKETEGAIAQAAEQGEQREALLYDEIQREVYLHLGALRHCSHSLCQLDALASFSQTAHEYRYTRPTLRKEQAINIVAGRHPVVEQSSINSFVPNETTLNERQRLLIITGPNMGGKSTYLRQVALISIMAQCGSFVPADLATLPLIDRIFTRIGSGDNVAQGKSTFLVEMEETAVICTQATQRSLVILDEVGRGTSTNDGIALAHAIIEYIYSQINALSLFATHYHELTHLAEEHEAIVNYHLSCQQQENELIFLHEVRPGHAAASFGLDVARQALIPLPIIYRAHELLTHYDHYRSTNSKTQKPILPTPTFNPALLIQEDAQIKAIKDELKTANLDNMTPRQALDLLYALKQKLG